MDANVTRAKIVNWLVREGESVSVGTPLVEIETEKAVFVIDSEAAGVVRRIIIEEGGTAAVGARLGVIGGVDEALTGERHPADPSIALEPVGPWESRDEKIDDEYALPDYTDALLGE